MSEGRSFAYPGLSAALSELWASTMGTPQIRVGILDGPADLKHPAFSASRLTQEDLDSAAAGQSPSDHGTHVASVIFGRHEGPVKGIAPGCSGVILPIYSVSGNGNLLATSQSVLSRAIVRAVESGCNVVNISGGELTPSGQMSPALRDALRYCEERGVLVVAATGNEGCDCVHVPAATETVLAVGASDNEGNPLGFSNWGEAYRSHGVLCPGLDIPGAVTNGGVALRTGTSFAAATVSGIAALLMALQLKNTGRASGSPVRAAIVETAIPCNAGSGSYCRRVLAGLIDPVAAREYVLKNASAVPLATLVRAAEYTESKPELLNENYESRSCRMERQVDSQDNPVPGRIPAPAPTTPQHAVAPSGCSCGGQGQAKPEFVNVIGTLNYDFGTWTRYEWYRTAMVTGSPMDPVKFANFIINPNPFSSGADAAPGILNGFNWTIEVMGVPLYAIKIPSGISAESVSSMLKEFFRDQVLGVSGSASGTFPAILAQTQPGPAPPQAVAKRVRGVLDESLQAAMSAAAIEIDNLALPKDAAAKELAGAKAAMPDLSKVQQQIENTLQFLSDPSLAGQGLANMMAIQSTEMVLIAGLAVVIVLEYAQTLATSSFRDAVEVNALTQNAKHAARGVANAIRMLQSVIGNAPHHDEVSAALTNSTKVSEALEAIPPAPPSAAASPVAPAVYKADACVIPGRIVGQTTLLNGQDVPLVEPDARGMFNWNSQLLTQKIIQKLASATGATSTGTITPDQFSALVAQLIGKLLNENANAGRIPADRAMNMAITLVFDFLNDLANQPASDNPLQTMIQGVRTQQSRVCRPGSDCWDVVITYFNTNNLLTQPRTVQRATFDVSDVVPVQVGPIAQWLSA